MYFSYSSLQAAGRLGGDHRLPGMGRWDRVAKDVLWVARKYRQISITVWYPHQFGSIDNNDNNDDRYRYQCIIQQVVPCRTGLDPIGSTAVVWLDTRNNSQPEKKSFVTNMRDVGENYNRWRELDDDRN